MTLKRYLTPERKKLKTLTLKFDIPDRKPKMNTNFRRFQPPLQPLSSLRKTYTLVIKRQKRSISTNILDLVKSIKPLTTQFCKNAKNTLSVIEILVNSLEGHYEDRTNYLISLIYTYSLGKEWAELYSTVITNCELILFII